MKLLTGILATIGALLFALLLLSLRILIFAAISWILVTLSDFLFNLFGVDIITPDNKGLFIFVSTLSLFFVSLINSRNSD
jgi:hypothetical protein